MCVCVCVCFMNTCVCVCVREGGRESLCAERNYKEGSLKLGISLARLPDTIA